MFVRLILRAAGRGSIEKEFDSIESLKATFLSNMKTYKIASVFLIEDFKKSSKLSLSLTDYDNQNKLIGLAYLCQKFNSVQELQKYHYDNYSCLEYFPNEDSFLNQVLKDLTPIQILDSTRSYRRSEPFFYLDESGNLNSTSQIHYFSNFDDLYMRYFENNSLEGVEWVGDVKLIQDGKVISNHQFTSKTLFYKNAYKDIQEQVLKFIDSYFVDSSSVDHEFTMRLKF